MNHYEPTQPNPDAIIRTLGDLQKELWRSINPDGSLKPDLIRTLLAHRRWDLAALAQAAICTLSYLHQVINREVHDRAVEDLIADRLGLRSSSDRIWGRG